jgi:hypothetical protein
MEARGVQGVGFEEIESIRAMIDSARPARINLARGKACRRRSGVFFIE